MGLFWSADDFYTVFGIEIAHLKPHLFYSILIGLLLFTVLVVLHQKRIIKISVVWLILLTSIIIIFIFLIFACLFPVRVLY